MQKPRLRDWLVCAGVLALGLGMLGVRLFNQRYGTTPEGELSIAEGVATDLKMSRVTNRNGWSEDYLDFTVGPYRTTYASHKPNYKYVLSAVQGDDPIRVWVSTKQETIFPRSGWVPLYGMSLAGRTVVSYDEIVGAKKTNEAPPVVEAVLILMGCYLFYVGVRSLRE